MAEREAPGSRPPELGETFDTVIIGAGIGGLACGALLAKEGLDVLVIERHKQPGGYVTAYSRKGYSFQVPHLIVGCGPNSTISRVVNHLGIDVEFNQVDPFHRYIYPDHDILVNSNPEIFSDVLKDAFQPQTARLNSFFKMLGSVGRGMNAKLLRRLIGGGPVTGLLNCLVRNPQVFRYMALDTSFSSVLDRYFNDDMLKAVLSTPWPYLGSLPSELPALSMIAMMNSYSEGVAVPVGGFQALSDAFARSLVDNGGKLLLGHEAVKINTDQGMVTGVEMYPRAKVSTSVVVSDADTKRTYLHLLDRGNFTRAFLERIEGSRLSVSGFAVHLGMATSIKDKDLACGTIFVNPSYDHAEILEEARSLDRYPDPEKVGFMLNIHSLEEPSLAPRGKTCMDILVPGVSYDFMNRWEVEEGGKRGDGYRSVKEKYAEVVVEAVRRAFPDLIRNVEAYDVSTPITYERYTMAADGCWFDSALAKGQTYNRRPGARSSVRDLYMTGSKSVPGGGINGSVLGGVLAADRILEGKLQELF